MMSEIVQELTIEAPPEDVFSFIFNLHQLRFARLWSQSRSAAKRIARSFRSPLHLICL